MDTEIVLHEDDNLRIVKRVVLGRFVLSFHGPITFQARRPFQESVTKLRAEGCRSLILHLTEVPFVDSVALALITITWRTWTEAGLMVVIAHPSPYVKELLTWPAAGFKDTELGVSMKPEVRHGATQVYARV